MCTDARPLYSTTVLLLALTPDQRVVTHAMISMIENHLSWVVMWWRAKYPDSVLKGYQVNLQNALNTRLPNPILNFCYKLTSGRKVSTKASDNFCF